MYALLLLFITNTSIFYYRCLGLPLFFPVLVSYSFVLLKGLVFCAYCFGGLLLFLSLGCVGLANLVMVFAVSVFYPTMSKWLL